MYKVVFRIRIPYYKLRNLRSQFNEDRSLDPKIKRPTKAPKNNTDIVEIRVTVQTQGSSHTGLIKKAIEFCDGTVVDTLNYGSDSWYIKTGHFFTRIGFTAIIAYSAIVGTTISFTPGIFQDPMTLLLLTAIVGIPLSIGVGTARIAL